ncbi:MAG: triose-phosphate isomerase [Lysobacterales bacterium CG02_land_8_20_14_3_00_62_12]|nr:MAG: triose-phosphate isomerase [Xanthomonadales bacterium CG02_land_8_20_14_3_00_62_12]
MRKPLVAGNWKLHGSVKLTTDLVKTWCAPGAPATVDVAVLPPYPYLGLALELVGNSGMWVGAQDCSVHAAGAYTGEVAAEMLAELGCRLVLVGHSERRQGHAESDALVAEKFAAARRAGLTPVLCLGETLAEREQGQTLVVLRRQLDAVITRVGIAAFAHAVLAYEPVWAIGTGRTATPAEAQQVHAELRSHVTGFDASIAGLLRIVYGGSVKAANAESLFAQPDIDGGLIGGAALVADEFLAIVRAAV